MQAFEAKLIEGTEGTIILKKGDVKVNGSSAEAYGLIVSDSGVEIQAFDGVGIFYGVQSLRALISVEYLASKTGKAIVPHVYVEDAPRFEYRGMHLDVVRNFSKKETVLNLIDLVSLLSTMNSSLIFPFIFIVILSPSKQFTF